jgi:ketosteroid isomerase-like protein
MAQDLAARVNALEAMVQELNDREAIRDLRYRYHEFVNEGKFADIANLFTEDGELDFAHLGKAKGKTEVAAFFRRPARSSSQESSQESLRGISFVKQFIHNHVIHLQGDRGTGFSYLEAKPVYNGESFLVAARYDDEYVKQDGQWKFKRMSLTPYFMVPLREGWAQEDRIKMGR